MVGSLFAASEGVTDLTNIRYKYNETDYINGGKTGSIDVRHINLKGP